MKTKIIITICSIALVFASCSKESKKTFNNSGYHPLAEVLKFVSSGDTSDFSILISTSTGTSLFSPFNVANSSCSIEAGSPSEVNEGTLTVNGINVPFDNKNYFLPTDTSLLATSFIGQSNTYEFSSTAGNISSFTTSKYCLDQTDLTFTGLSSNKIGSSSDITMYWDSEPNLPSHGKSGILLYADDPSTGNVISEIFEVDDSIEEYTLSSTVLSQFPDRVTIFYVRAYNDIETLNGSEVNFKFIGYSWATLLFE